MDLGRIKELKEMVEAEYISYGELSEIEAAFQELVDSGAELRDLPENALAMDMLDELEAHVTPIERVIYHWVADHFGENEAMNPSWSTRALAEEINKVSIIMGVENGTIGALLGGQNAVDEVS